LFLTLFKPYTLILIFKNELSKSHILNHIENVVLEMYFFCPYSISLIGKIDFELKIKVNKYIINIAHEKCLRRACKNYTYV